MIKALVMKETGDNKIVEIKGTPRAGDGLPVLDRDDTVKHLVWLPSLINKDLEGLGIDVTILVG